MEPTIYLDNSSTTKVCAPAVEKMLNMMTENYANADSLHYKGIQAEREVEQSRKVIADFLNCIPEEIYFTSGGTESNNLAIIGSVLARRRIGNRIVSSSIEHPSVMEAMKLFEQQGFEVIYLQPDRNGLILSDKIYNAINSKTILVSIMLVNNELGSIQPVESIKKSVIDKVSPALIHTDAVQAFGKIEVDPQKLGVDLLSICSHKIHGPKGIGALYKKKGTKINAISFGGGQERALRSGTVATELVCGFAEAVKQLDNFRLDFNKIKHLRDYALAKLREIDAIKINSSSESLPYILNFSVGHIRSETLLHFLAGRNIFVSSGSACAKGKSSYVLKSIGLDARRIDSSIRVSFSRYNDKGDVDKLVDSLQDALRVLLQAH